jgi:hypothetical protein
MGTGVAGPELLGFGIGSALGLDFEGAGAATGFSSGVLLLQLSQLESHGDFCVVVADAGAGLSRSGVFFGCG